IGYTPNPGFVGTDTCTYSVEGDSKGLVATVTVTVTGISSVVDRNVFVVDNVTNIDDGQYGPGQFTLLEAIQLSNDPARFPGRQKITFNEDVFSSPQTITLDTTALVIMDEGVDIVGPGAGLLTVNGNSNLSTQGVFVNFAKTTISGLTIANGNRDNGGGVLNVPNIFIENPPLPELTLTKCVIRNNRAAALSIGNGGGIENQFGTLTINNCTISDNFASQAGGGVSNFKGTVFINNSTINGNNALAAGGVFNLFGSMTLTNVTVSGNSALEVGGGIANPSEPGTMTIINSTITGNFADSDNNSTDDTGGGLYTSKLAGNRVILRNTIVAGNFVNGSPTDLLNVVSNDIDGPILVLVDESSNNLIGNPGTAGGLVNGVNGNIVGNNGAIWNIDAILDRNLRDNGSSTLTHALVVGGPAVNTGSNSGLTDLTTDQNGSPRVAGGTVDIGASEIDSDSLFVTNIDDGDSDNQILPNRDLTYRITFNQAIDPSTLSPADFANSGTAPITIGAITAISPTV
ncbi:MAG: choice-of-anchor Q domain-containing protein, partial [Gemmataceae bacterium]